MAEVECEPGEVPQGLWTESPRPAMLFPECHRSEESGEKSCSRCVSVTPVLVHIPHCVVCVSSMGAGGAQQYTKVVN